MSLAALWLATKISAFALVAIYGINKLASRKGVEVPLTFVEHMQQSTGRCVWMCEVRDGNGVHINHRCMRSCAKATLGLMTLISGAREQEVQELKKNRKELDEYIETFSDSNRNLDLAIELLRWIIKEPEAARRINNVAFVKSFHAPICSAQPITCSQTEYCGLLDDLWPYNVTMENSVESADSLCYPTTFKNKPIDAKTESPLTKNVVSPQPYSKSYDVTFYKYLHLMAFLLNGGNSLCLDTSTSDEL